MKHYSSQTHRFGFTIVELLVIIVVIAILVSITVVSYTMITDNAKHKTVETDAQGIAVY
jgi:Tfp pilus assembly protein PilE